MLILMHDEAKGSSEKCLHRSDINLAIALACMPIACFEKSSLGMNRDIKCCARDKLLVIHVARVHPRRGAVETPRRLRRSYAHTAKERMQRNLDSRCKFCNHPLTIEWNNLRSAVRIVVR